LVSGDGFGTVLPGEATALGSCMALQTDAQISGLYWPSDTQMGNPIQTSGSCFLRTPSQRDPTF